MATEGAEPKPPARPTSPVPQLTSEIEGMRRRITEYVHDRHVRDIFSSINCDDYGPCDPLLAAHFVLLMQKMDDTERHNLVSSLVRMSHESGALPAEPQNLRNEYEYVVDSLLTHAYEEGILSINHCIEGLCMTSDFTLRHKINRRKWEFIKQSVPTMDYKGVRIMFRYLIESQFSMLPQKLSLESVQQLEIIEDILILILDRDVNVIPPIFSVVEANKCVSKQAYIFPRLAHMLSQLSIHFRPVAELTHVMGRGFLYPLPQHPCFAGSSPSWRIDGTLLLGHMRAHQQQFQFLPYRIEHSAAQTFLLYMVLRQPRGKDYILTLTRSQKFVKAPWDVLISIMMCELLVESEKLDERENIPRYQWDNVLSIVHQGILNQTINAQIYFAMLHGLAKSAKFIRARDEVMWIVLQIAGMVPITEGALNEIVELYKVLFTGEIVWAGASDHVAQFVRFFSAACTWLILDGKEGLPEPSDSIKRQISIIKGQASKLNDSLDDAMLAVLANAYRSETVVGKQVQMIFQLRMDGTPNAESLFTLPYGRRAANRLNSFSTEFLDSLTFRARGAMLSTCLNSLRTFSSDRSPSPAVLDTLARLISSMELDFTRQVVSMLQRSVMATLAQNSVETAREQCYIIYEFLCYRLPTVPLGSSRSTLWLSSLSCLLQLTTMKCHQLYGVIEQMLMRQWCWAPHNDMIHNAIYIIGKAEDLVDPNTFATFSQNTNRTFPICPEIFRMLIINTMRAAKITGFEFGEELPRLEKTISNFSWPMSTIPSFPTSSHPFMRSIESELTFEDLNKAVKDNYSLTLGMGAEHYTSYSVEQNESPAFLAVIYYHLMENPDSALPLDFYKVLHKKTPRDVIVATNYLVDYVIAQINFDLTNAPLWSSITKTLTEMVFRWQVVGADRLLLSLVMHPASDRMLHVAMLITNAFCLSSEFIERIKYFHDHLPRKNHSHSEFTRKLVDYHNRYPEFTVMENIVSYGKQVVIHPNAHLPTYYGCMVERLLPICDFIICRAMEVSLDETTCQNLIQTIACLYKFHPAPITFLYTTLYYLQGIIKKPLARKFLLTIKQYAEDVALTSCFEKNNHQLVSLEPLIAELVERVASSVEFILTPPSFVSQDWRTAEFTPGAQTIYLACIELLASPHDPQVVVTGMINMLMVRPHQRPYNVVNIIALLLTALPDAFGKVLQDEFIAVIDKNMLEGYDFEVLIFDTFEEAQLLHLTSRPMIINVISQAYWSHCKLEMLTNFASTFALTALKAVKTENELWYTLRLVVPLLQRCYERQRDKGRHLKDSLNVVGEILTCVANLASKGAEFVHADEICDLLYLFKYIFVGDYLKRNADTEFPRLPERMQERLKFYSTQSDGNPDTAGQPPAV